MSDLPSVSVVNLGEFSKPANTLIEKISDAIGGIFRPYQIRRIAQAEVDAEMVKAVSQIEISDLQRRAIRRFFVEEAKKQDNIETITQKALPDLGDQATPQDVEDDWITNFFDKCRLISDEQMQAVWAKVLAGEANAPGKYSKRTVNLLAGMDKTDAEMFAGLCSFAFSAGEVTPLIYDIEHKIYQEHGVNLTSLSHLETIGLVHFNGLAGYLRTGFKQEEVVTYFGVPVWIGFDKPEDNVMQLGHVLLSQMGHQLAPICGARPREGFIDYVREKWRGFGYRVEGDEGEKR